MNSFQKNCIKGRIIQLAKLRSTGTPAQLAMKFEISERSVKRIINELRQAGNNIRFDYNYVSYVWTENE
jgi:predicted DNA-binding transcriptional regulator YafY